MATRVEIKDDRSSFLRMMVGFLPLAFGYFLSVLFQSVDPLIADDLMTDLAIGKGTLGMLTAAFPLAFAVCLLPSGIAIDRFGPRAVQPVMMAVTALGALIFSLSTGPFGLTIGRTLLGVGTASALLAAMKAIVTWFPRERLGLVTGALITVAGIGALAMADPAALFVRANGWRALFMLLAALATLCAILAVLLVPTPATVTGDVPDQDRGLPFVLRDPIFRTICAAGCDCGRDGMGDPGQWVAGWLGVNGVRLTSIITYISFIAVGQAAGALVWGWLADWAVRRGLSAASVFVGAVALCVCIQLAAVVRNRIADLYRLGRVAGWRRSHAALHGPVDAFSPSLCGASVREHRRIAVCCHPFHPVGRWWRRRDMAARGIRSDVSDRLCDGIHGADRIATRCSGLVPVSAIGNTRRRAERRGNRCCV